MRRRSGVFLEEEVRPALRGSSSSWPGAAIASTPPRTTRAQTAVDKTSGYSRCGSILTEGHRRWSRQSEQARPVRQLRTGLSTPTTHARCSRAPSTTHHRRRYRLRSGDDIPSDCAGLSLSAIAFLIDLTSELVNRRRHRVDRSLGTDAPLWHRRADSAATTSTIASTPTSRSPQRTAGSRTRPTSPQAPYDSVCRTPPSAPSAPASGVVSPLAP